VEKLIPKLQVSNLAVDLGKLNTDSINAKRNRQLLKAYRTDPYLNEAVKVMDDMIAEPSLGNGKLTKAAAHNAG
jgi:hypothetical protein